MIVLFSVPQGGRPFFLVCLCALLLSSSLHPSPDNAPELDFPQGLEWLNVERPLTAADLQGKVVILDFWTYGCINCIHVVEELYREGIDEHPLPIALDKTRVADSRLAAPGKIAVSGDASRIAISDTLHHRIILADADRRVIRTFGSGKPGLRDGPADKAQLSSPQGLVFGDGFLLVADTGNHAVRLLDLAGGQVKTLAGTGRIGELPPGEYDALHQGLRSPWDLALKGSDLYIAMAGNHQIWRLGSEDGKIRPYAGSRREGIDTGSLDRASFSQPSGLALSGENLYVADAEASAIRRIRMSKEVVENLVGKGLLFEFGDQDGALSDVRLQHASGVALLDADRLLIADTYNHKVKLLGLKKGMATTLLGAEEPGARLGSTAETQLNGPGGVAVLDGRILVADTNNHWILELDPDADRVRAWPLQEYQ